MKTQLEKLQERQAAGPAPRYVRPEPKRPRRRRPHPSECNWKADPVCPGCGHVDEFWDDSSLAHARDRDVRPHRCPWCRMEYRVEVATLYRFTTSAAPVERERIELKLRDEDDAC